MYFFLAILVHKHFDRLEIVCRLVLLHYFHTAFHGSPCPEP